MEVLSNTGAYSAHGHGVCGNIGGQFSVLYKAPNLSYKATTVYTNLLIASVMRGYGVGMALFSYFQSTFPHNVELSGARIMMNENGSATLFIGCAEIGQGTDTVMAQIAAEAIGIKVIGSDTAICPFDSGAYASRQTYVSGMAVKKAGKKCRKAILKKAAIVLGKDRKDLDLKEGNVIHRDTGKPITTVKEITIDQCAHFWRCFCRSYN